MTEKEEKASDTKAEQSDKSQDIKQAYSLDYIFQGKGKHFGLFKDEEAEANTDEKENNIIQFPFRDNDKWQNIQKVFSTDVNQFENELKYLQSLFQELAAHPAKKFISFLEKLKSKKKTSQIYETFIKNTLRFMIEHLILNMQSIFADDYNLEILPLCVNKQITLTRGQIASLLACCFFDLLPKHCSFSCELNVAGFAGKFNCWIHYFEYARNKGVNSDWFNKQTVTIHRRYMTTKQLAPILEHDKLSANDTRLAPFVVHHEGCIEDYAIAMHADFANMLIGGGVLDGGRVQEEIRFTVNSECVIAKLLCPDEMRNNESIIIVGSQQFCNYKGYGYKFKFDGYRNGDDVPLVNNRLATCIVGIDAIHFYKPSDQCDINMLIREVAKSYIGYSLTNEQIGYKMEVVSTGNWGCGIFMGDPVVKAMIQWISITLSGRSVSYYTFKDKRVIYHLEPLVKAMLDKKITIGQLWTAMSDETFAEQYSNSEITISQHLFRVLKLEI